MTHAHGNSSELRDRPQQGQGEPARAAWGGEGVPDHHIEEVLAALDKLARVQPGSPGEARG